MDNKLKNINTHYLKNDFMVNSFIIIFNNRQTQNNFNC